MHDTEYAELCKQIVNLKEFLRSKYRLVLQVREEHPTMVRSNIDPFELSIFLFSVFYRWWNMSRLCRTLLSTL